MTEIRNELLDELLKDYKNPEDLIGKDGLLKQLTKRLLERAMNAEMDHHLGYQKHESSPAKRTNSRNGHGKKTVLTQDDAIEIQTPRDRNSAFEPKILPKRQKRFDGFDDKIIALYARGMSVRDIQSNLEEIYGVEVSEGLISEVTDAVLDDVKAWQSRPLDAVYPIVFLDGIVVKSRQDGRVRNKTVYLALGVNLDGEKELLGLWIANTEGAKFWLSVITELKNRGVQDVLIACVDGLKGLPEAIESVYPDADVQLCIVHMIRNSARYVNWKDRKALCADLKTIYGAATREEAELALQTFAERWDEKYPTVSRMWREHWDRLTTFFDYCPEIRKVMYTTNAIESLNRSLRKVLKTKGAFPNDEAIMKLMYLALQTIAKKWTMPIQHWKPALNQLAIRFEGRLPLGGRE
ncbi:MAG: IS256 family transposase [Sulfuricella denitrificans]|nr:IS256 family transposase [Sulfuricella denitrificans]